MNSTHGQRSHVAYTMALRLGMTPLDRLVDSANSDPATAGALKLCRTIVNNLCAHPGGSTCACAFGRAGNSRDAVHLSN